ncbi:DUF1592 domain-containing protein [Blastopirellula sp. J2-11]|uniref:DUF1592 domain-containing protein n=1 Tax=Blastopirellula sp. J2-11 TaxID=2943192 RepID=UPI0021C9E020|nr:DUF1592 domain-containing protein [Blastopirellula sp. J2-11]UUO09191.1 DUF1592 domain-containing protein [Blastopirellula sp. J2-11]
MRPPGLAARFYDRPCWRIITVCALLTMAPAVLLAEPFAPLGQQYIEKFQPLLKTYCLDCHSTDAKEGELDLERFADIAAIRHDPAVWQRVAEMIAGGEMPPAESAQPTAAERQHLLAWTTSYLDAEAKANAGDPGPVLLRRLNNAEYAYTLHDLTGIDFDPTREFPIDGAAGEGFTNTGASLVMSPALFRKYLDAGQAIAQHAVLLPDGFRFIEGTTRRDAINELIAQIREIYTRHTLDGSDPSVLDLWTIVDPQVGTKLDGRVDLDLYLTALVRHRERLQREPGAAAKIAVAEKINPPYFSRMAELLLGSATQSPLLDDLRLRIAAANEQEALQIASDIRAWQERLWKFNRVGHFGSIRPWQQSQDAVVASQDFRITVNLEEGEPDLLLLTTGTSGDEYQNDVALWRNPRFLRTGGRTIPLRDLHDVANAYEQNRQEVLEHLSRYLSAAWEIKTTNQAPDITATAQSHQVDPVLLSAWIRYLGISAIEPVTFAEYLDQPLDNSTAIRGWGRAGLKDLSLVANSTEETIRIPGDVRPHSIAVHPRPERWIAVAWRCPTDGTYRAQPEAFDAHNACGNGFQWRLEHRRPGEQRILGAADVGSGLAAEFPSLPNLAMKKGDMLALLIGPRDQEHACDLTGIELEIQSTTDKNRSWSLSQDCADSIADGNPHADKQGNADVWHFFAQTFELLENDRRVQDSLVAQWSRAADEKRASEIAAEMELRVQLSSTASREDPNPNLFRELTSLDGPLLASLTNEDLANVKVATPLNYGVAPDRFVPDSANDLISRAPEILEVALPANMLTGYEFVVTATLADAAQNEGSVQMEVGRTRAATTRLITGASIIAAPGSAAAQRFATSMSQFRELFPIAFCYPQIVPVDEVVTLVLYHREDEPLRRLLLTESETARLNRLWSELRFVSGDALTIVGAFEQLLEYATQDGRPSDFDPVRQPIQDSATAYRRQLAQAEPAQLNALVEFAAQLYRRPLTIQEETGIRTLYDKLRTQEFDHEQAFRLSLGRLFASPAFLYRLETPRPGRGSSPISSRELATRLSYFLWSSLPDAELEQLAADDQLQDEATLRVEVERMQADPRSRRLAIEFACQWMHIRNFDQFDEKSEQHFPEFADLRGPMYEESVQFFADLIRRNGSIFEILDADHTFLNETLAKHYGIPGVIGSHWRRVDGVKQYARGGILGQGSVLSMQAGASRTSPILRGAWVSETLLGERLPRPPKDVPILPEAAPAGLTERQLTEQHTSVAACAKCHARIDPYGFALENFDAIGRFRQQDAQGSQIVTDSVLLDGTELAGYHDLRDYLAGDRRTAFVRQFCRKLLGYALGRSIRLSDQPLLTKMEEQLAQNDYRIGAAIEAVVLSRQFRELRDQQFADID